MSCSSQGETLPHTAESDQLVNSSFYSRTDQSRMPGEENRTAMGIASRHFPLLPSGRGYILVDPRMRGNILR